jgi:hypothetical protein
MVTCDGCGQSVRAKSENAPEALPDNGWKIDLGRIDYEGGFTDVFESVPFLMCHDCCVKLLDTFPLIAERVPKGSHPCADDVPCCDYAWKWGAFDEILLAKDGKWSYEPTRSN